MHRFCIKLHSCQHLEEIFRGRGFGLCIVKKPDRTVDPEATLLWHLSGTDALTFSLLDRKSR